MTGFVTARRTAKKKKAEKGNKKSHPMDLQSCHQAAVSAQSRENLAAAQAGRAVPAQAGLTHHSWAMPSAKKGSPFLTNKLWAGCQLPVSEGGNAAPWRKAGSRHWKDLTLPRVGWFRRMSQGQLVCPVYQNSPVRNPVQHKLMKLTSTSVGHQKPLCSTSRAGRHLFNNLQCGAKSKAQQQSYYPQTFRHLPYFI